MTFREKAATLRRYGFKTTYGQVSKGSIAQKKSAISRTWSRIGRYLDSPRFIHVKASRSVRDSHSSKAVKTPDGWFEQIPQGIDRKRVRIRVSGKNVVKSYYDPTRGIDRIDTIIPLKAERMATDPGPYVEGEIKKHNSARYSHIVVKGFEGANRIAIKDSGRYIDDFVREIVDERKAMTYEQFEDTFQLKLITAKDDRRRFGPRQKKAKKKKRGKKK